jgi:hypothetical protein
MTEVSSPISASPRPLTDKARRRAWNEPSVRAWCLIALAMAAVAAWILIEQILIARTTRYRMANWTRVDAATVETIGDSSRTTYRVTPDQLVSLPVKVTYFDLLAGTTRELIGKLEAQRQPLSPGNKIPILVDPADPKRWTDRVRPAPLFEEFLAALLLMPLPFILAGVALRRRWRVLKVWQQGELRQGTVMERRHSAVAPRSAILRCAVEDSRDKRLLSVAVPRSAHAFELGDRIALVTSPGAGWAIAAMLYEESAVGSRR